MARLDDFGYSPPVRWPRGRRPPGLEGFGARMKQVRQSAGLSHAALAELTELSASFVSHVESGGDLPSYRSALMLAAALGVDAHWLISGEGQP